MKLTRDHYLGLILLTVLMALGWALFQWLNQGYSSADESSFPLWFWSQRDFDLVLQIGLIFAGALGISAILPQEIQDDDR